MKFIHLSDLHIGKKVNEFSMLEDQKFILNQILDILDDTKADALIIAGDVYDKPVPSAESVRLLDSFITSLSERNIPVFIISGNHDSPERLSFGSSLMAKSKIFTSPVFEGSISPIKLEDEHGDIYVYPLPFIKPSTIRHFFPDEKIESYTDMMSFVLKNLNIDTSKRNILISHQFAAGAERSDSEDILSAGGIDSIEPSVFFDFDYVALGHIHRPQSIKRNTLRYCGTPLKYSFSEEHHKKSVTVFELLEKGNISINEIPLLPLRDMRTIKGSYIELTSLSYYENTKTDDYIRIILTDEDDVVNAMSRLRTIYPNLMALSYENTRMKTFSDTQTLEYSETKTPMEHFSDFFEALNGDKMSEKQFLFAQKLIEEILEEDKK